MTDLEVLQELILAARAEGDGDTADWLASIADDPAAVARVTGANSNDGAPPADDPPPEG